MDSSGHIAIDTWGGGGGGGIAVLMAISGPVLSKAEGLAQRVGQQVQSLTAST